MACTLHVFAARPGPRHRYIFQWFAERMGFALHWFQQGEAPGEGWQIWYHAAEPPVDWQDALWVKPHGLLEEKGISKWTMPMGQWDDLPTLFPQEKGSLPFDLFAASFFLISRYEEYWPHRRDAYDRYDYRQSLAARQQFLQRPLVDEWLHQLRQWAAAERPHWPPAKALALPHRHSFDVDIAFQFRGHGLAKLGYHWLKAMATGHAKQAARLWSIYRGKQQDPYDVFNWIMGLHKTLVCRPVFYFLLSRRQHVYDKNVPLGNGAVKGLAEVMNIAFATGLHPGWQASEDPQALAREAAAYAALGLGAPKRSRYHYLHFQLPEGYRQLLALGIEEDASMGYGEVNGFRASTCQPFQWYDLLADAPTSLLIHPFGFMDANALFEEKLSPEQAQQQLAGLMAACERCGGGLEAVWHNHFLTEEQHADWRPLLEWFVARLV